MNTEFDPNALPPANDEDTGYKISLTRKIIMVIFILGFWIFFYWNTSAQNPAPATPASTSVETNSAN
ncbi:MAG: hypothetical protein COV66_01385 [Nitrospinae bacterium CG11_big_fil_rev_8_21_14_0_20_45_15]|nr:MAG: hypothetical protein COV66_01385 [Nitrospinae bacterium CG11_big_fil_rev_8_21_14_0_20_45_15]